MVTTPARRPLSTNSFMPAFNRARRSADMPSLSALAVGKSCTAGITGAAVRAAKEAMASKRGKCMRGLPVLMLLIDPKLECMPRRLSALGSLEYPARHKVEQRGASALIFVVDFVKEPRIGHEPLIPRTA